jgi:metallo-beta-lactamase family protein
VHGEWLAVKAKIRQLDGLSGHADYLELATWLAASTLSPRTRIYLVHGEPDALESMSDYLKQTTDFDVNIGDYRGILQLP